MSISRETQDRRPPASLDLELAVLGGIMLGVAGFRDSEAEAWQPGMSPADLWRQAAEQIDVEAFYSDGHGITFRLMGDLVARGVQPDSLAVIDELRARPYTGPGASSGSTLLDSVGGAGMIMAAISAVPTGANVENHVKKLRAKAISRRAIFELSVGIDALYRQEQTNEELLGRVVERLGILQNATGPELDFTAVGDVLAGIDAGVEARLNACAEAALHGLPNPPRNLGLQTGLPKLTEWTGGLKGGELWLIGARPGEFKSALAMEFTRLAILRDVPTVFFSLEMPESELSKRLLCAQSFDGMDCLDFDALDWPEEMTGGQRIMYDTARGQLAGRPLIFPTEITSSFPTIVAQIRRLKKRENIGLAVVDYAQLLESGGRGGVENRTLEVGAFSRGFKRLALELDIPIVLPAQLNRGSTGSGTSKARAPRLEDFRECDAMTHDADIVVMNWLPEGRSEPPEYGLTKYKVDFILRKNRNRPTGTVRAMAAADCGRFQQMRHEPPKVQGRGDPAETQ